ncbi:hypothetical protein [Zoogloea sp.]|uniref:hypothetical protein n=1 Tax=Zoogloea sp. TaxID=49181 RepID=UPI0035B1C2C8
MDIQEAVLIKRILDALTGTEGMPVRQLANKCQASPRRVNHLILHLAMAGLVDILSTGKVRISEKLAIRLSNHIRSINGTDMKRTAAIFNAIFGGGSQ